MYGKSLSAGPCEVLYIDLVINWEYLAHNKGAKPRNYAPGNNIYLWRFSLIVAGAEPPEKGGYTRTLQNVQDVRDVRDVQKRYETYKNAAIYKNETQLEFEFDLHCHIFQ